MAELLPAGSSRCLGGVSYLRALRILIVTPAPPRARTGNRVTAQRWARILRSLGHRVTLAGEYRRQPCDILVALHARKSAHSVALFRRLRPQAPIIVALTGTDLYRDIRSSASARRSLETASRLVVLHPLATRELPKRLHPRVRVIFQSANTPAPARGRAARTFDVAVLAHLRPVKDPLRAARAARLLPASSRVRILHLGAALDERARARAQREQATNPRYLWVGTVARGRALRVLSRCRLLVLSSRLEGGANVVSEALAASVPVISSRIPGSIGILGRDYPGYFPVGDTRALSALLRRAETNRSFYRTLRRWCRRLRPLVAPARERAAWARVLRELPGPKARSRAPR